MDEQQAFENFEACMEGHETAADFFKAGWKARGEYARGQQEPVGHIMIDTGDFEHGTKEYHLDGNWEPVYTATAQPVQPAKPNVCKYSDCAHKDCGRFYDHNSRGMSCRALAFGACAAGYEIQQNKGE